MRHVGVREVQTLVLRVRSLEVQSTRNPSYFHEALHTATLLEDVVVVRVLVVQVQLLQLGRHELLHAIHLPVPFITHEILLVRHRPSV